MSNTGSSVVSLAANTTQCTAQPLPFKGTAFDFGDGQIFIIPSLTARDLKRLKGEISILQNVANIDVIDSVDACVSLVHAALSRNYPTISNYDVSGLIDVSNMLQAVSCAMGIQSKPLEKAEIRSTKQHTASRFFGGAK